MALFFNNIFICENNCVNPALKIQEKLGLSPEDFYLICNGKLVRNSENLPQSNLHIVPRLKGGKGGFGSMLRAIGAQIEKTTNREACRDLSGRRLRDINEEQRLKKWIEAQAEREKETAERRQKKLEKLCEKPKFEFRDEKYDMERSLLPEIVEDAVLKGISKASTSKTLVEKKKEKKNKNKTKLWIDEEFSSCSDSDKESTTEETDEKTVKNESKQEARTEEKPNKEQEKGEKRKNDKDEPENVNKKLKKHN